MYYEDLRRSQLNRHEVQKKYNRWMHVLKANNFSAADASRFLQLPNYLLILAPLSWDTCLERGTTPSQFVALLEAINQRIQKHEQSDELKKQLQIKDSNLTLHLSQASYFLTQVSKDEQVWLLDIAINGRNKSPLTLNCIVNKLLIEAGFQSKKIASILHKHKKQTTLLFNYVYCHLELLTHDITLSMDQISEIMLYGENPIKLLNFYLDSAAEITSYIDIKTADAHPAPSVPTLLNQDVQHEYLKHIHKAIKSKKSAHEAAQLFKTQENRESSVLTYAPSV